RDSQLPGYTRRPDALIDARGGFKQVTAELLKRIEVSLNGQAFRAYDLAYQQGPFGKTLLASITQSAIDANGVYTLPPHVSSYYDDVRDPAGSTYQGFGGKQTWSTGSDGVDWTTTSGGVADKLGGVLVQIANDSSLGGVGSASALSGSVSDNVGGH